MSTVKFRLALKQINKTFIQKMSTVSKENPVNLNNYHMNKKPFYIFPIPKDITPSFELVRTLSNALNKMTYYYYEKEYSDKNFISGANLAITQMAKAIREHDIEAINELTVKQFATEIREKMAIIPQDVLKERLSFTKDNIVHAFIHALFTAPQKPFNLDPEALCFYGKVVAIIDPNSTQQVSLNKALKNANDDTLFCNVTVCRHLNPLDIWKISHINFFDKRFVY
uniref:Tim44-like domain-containing protein n=1 Tax=Panagrolaimus sp. PS1159 TaxID=55785 RepID=A0AC35FSA2_9BILA